MKSNSILSAIAGLTLLLAFPSVVEAQQQWHHVHLNTTDRASARTWYIDHMGAAPRGSTGVRSGSTAINLWETAPGFAGSAGSSLDHLGFSVSDLHTKIAELRAAGVEIVSEPKEVHGIKYAYVQDPWGNKIEVLEDTALLGFHHVHLLVGDVDRVRDWFLTMFGGESVDYADLIPSVDYGDMWLMISLNNTESPLAPTLGRSLDHIGYTVSDIDAELERMTALGVEVQEGPRASRAGGATVAYVMGPEGIRIELLQLSTN